MVCKARDKRSVTLTILMNGMGGAALAEVTPNIEQTWLSILHYRWLFFFLTLSHRRSTFDSTVYYIFVYFYFCASSHQTDKTVATMNELYRFV